MVEEEIGRSDGQVNRSGGMKPPLQPIYDRICIRGAMARQPPPLFPYATVTAVPLALTISMPPPLPVEIVS
jgi:hypothetical protein